METVQIAAIVVRTKKDSVSCRFASSPFDNIAVTEKTPTEENGHALHQHLNARSNESPTDRGRDGVHAQAHSRGHEGGMAARMRGRALWHYRRPRAQRGRRQDKGQRRTFHRDDSGTA